MKTWIVRGTIERSIDFSITVEAEDELQAIQNGYALALEGESDETPTHSEIELYDMTAEEK